MSSPLFNVPFLLICVFSFSSTLVLLDFVDLWKLIIITDFAMATAMVHNHLEPITDDCLEPSFAFDRTSVESCLSWTHQHPDATYWHCSSHSIFWHPEAKWLIVYIAGKKSRKHIRAVDSRNSSAEEINNSFESSSHHRSIEPTECHLSSSLMLNNLIDAGESVKLPWMMACLSTNKSNTKARHAALWSKQNSINQSSDRRKSLFSWLNRDEVKSSRCRGENVLLLTIVVKHFQRCFL